MNSLFELNQYSTRTAITVTDERPATVIFDRPETVDPNDQILDITSQTVNVAPGLEIEEIVNYSTANVRYEIYINEAIQWVPFSSSITWNTLPNHVTRTVSGNTYTLTGLRDKNDWDTVKNFIWNLPTGYQVGALWYLIVKVIWYDQAEAQEKYRGWLVFDPDFYTVAEFKVSSSLTAEAKKLFRPALAFNSSASWFCAEGVAKQGRAQLNTAFTASAEGDITYLASLNFSASLTASFGKIFSTAVSTQPITASFSTKITYLTNAYATLNSSAATSGVANIIEPISNITTRLFKKNIANNIFSISPPQITDPSNTGTWTFTITSADGEFGSSNDNTQAFTTLSYTGTKAQVNSWLSTVLFYPNYNFTSNSSYTITLSKSGSYSVSRTAVLNYNGTQTLPNYSYTFTSSGTWTPVVVEEKYNYTANVFMIGGGGGGSAGGGGAGGSTYLTELPINGAESITVGTGGAPGAVTTANGANGTNSSAFGYTVNGGEGGKYMSSPLPPEGVTSFGRGGNSGSPSNRLGGLGYSDPPNSRYFGGGGGGAGTAGEMYEGTGNQIRGGYGVNSSNSLVSDYTTGFGIGGPVNYAQPTTAGSGGRNGGSNSGQNGIVIIFTIPPV